MNAAQKLEHLEDRIAEHGVTVRALEHQRTQSIAAHAALLNEFDARIKSAQRELARLTERELPRARRAARAEARQVQLAADIAELARLERQEQEEQDRQHRLTELRRSVPSELRRTVGSP